MFELSRHNDPRKTSGWYLEAQCVKSFNKGGLNRCLADGVLPFFFFFHHAHSNIYRTRVSARVSWFALVTLYTNKTIIKISLDSRILLELYIYIYEFLLQYTPHLNSSKFCLTTRNSIFPLYISIVFILSFLPYPGKQRMKSIE